MSGHNKPFTPEALLTSLKALPTPEKYWVGFSGGADSTALMQALHELHTHLPACFEALHVNHGLHPEAGAWQAHCESFCHERGIPLRSISVEVAANTGHGIEAEARHQRYRVAEELLSQGEMLLTGHHSDDQAETLLLNLMRGSGIDGLAGMPPIRAIGKALLARPLLAFRGAALKSFLADRNIAWIEDASNLNETYDRNFLRHSLMPVLEQRWGRATEKIALSAEHCRESAHLLANLADSDLEQNQAHPRVLRTTAFTAAGLPRLKLAIRRWLAREGAPHLPSRRLEELCRQTVSVGSDQGVRMEWAGWVLHYYREALWLQTTSSISPCPSMEWTRDSRIGLAASTGSMEISPAGCGLPADLTVCARKGGESIRLTERDGSRSIKYIFQQQSLPPWLRFSVPLLSMGDEVVAIGDMMISQRLREWLDAHGAKLVWTPGDPLLIYLRETWRAKAVDPSGPLG